VQKLKLSLGFLILECPKRSLLTEGRNLLPTFDFNFAKCLTFPINKQQLITLSLTAQSKGCTARRPKDALRARATAATWSEELPFILLELRAQPRENTGLSPAEAVFGAQIVLPNEFLQNYEFSVDIIVEKLSKTLHVSAPSLPRHNSSTDLPSELPAELFSVGAAWFHLFS
jgi:hypothetical protein